MWPINWQLRELLGMVTELESFETKSTGLFSKPEFEEDSKLNTSSFSKNSLIAKAVVA